MTGPLRTISNIRDITDRLENEELSKAEKQGFYGHSHFLDLDNFDFIDNIPAEYMHSICHGVVKRLLELTFKTGSSRERQIKRPLSDPRDYNTAMSKIKVPRDFSRRVRTLDLGVMKAQEFRNVILFFVSIILICIPDTYRQEKQLWLHIWFMVRACTVPNTEYADLNTAQILESSATFYKMFQSVYGQKNIRGEEPLTERSGFRFENYFAQLRNMHHPGTVSSLKQLLQNSFMKKVVENHSCKPYIHYCPDKRLKTRECNSLIYIYRQSSYEIYKLKKKQDHNTYLCHPHGRFKYTNPLTPTIDWSQVGVFHKGPISSDEILINKKDIHGKVIDVNSILITCPANVLIEK